MVEARKLEYDHPATPNPRKEVKPSQTIPCPYSKLLESTVCRVHRGFLSLTGGVLTMAQMVGWLTILRSLVCDVGPTAILRTAATWLVLPRS